VWKSRPDGGCGCDVGRLASADGDTNTAPSTPRKNEIDATGRLMCDDDDWSATGGGTGLS
jgi:hypothetical protein